MMTASFRPFHFLFGLFLVTSTSEAFHARSVKPIWTASSSSSSTGLFLSSSSSTNHHRLNEQDAAYLLAKAKECAFSDTCSIEESHQHLVDMINLQMACACGAVVGHNVCEEPQEAAEIVARLRQHIHHGEHGLTTRQQAFLSGGLLPLVFLALTVLSMALIPSTVNPNVEAFTAQEIVWAVRDGYLDDLAKHFLQNGGLLVSDTTIVPFTAQEWKMAAQGGFLDDMIHHYLQNGGL